MSDTMTIRIPQSVYYDALDPDASGMAAEIGLPDPEYVRIGKGASYLYKGVTIEQALDVAEYIGDRASMLLGQGYRGMSEDPEEVRVRGCYRAAIKAAEKIRKNVEIARKG
jgi:hypothetical protein